MILHIMIVLHQALTCVCLAQARQAHSDRTTMLSLSSCCARLPYTPCKGGPAFDTGSWSAAASQRVNAVSTRMPWTFCTQLCSEMGVEHDRATCLFQKASSGTWCRLRAVRGAAAVLLTQTRVSRVRRWLGCDMPRLHRSQSAVPTPAAGCRSSNVAGSAVCA